MHFLLLLLSLLCCNFAAGSLNQFVWDNTAVGPQNNATACIVANVQYPSGFAANYSSLRLTGTISDLSNETMTFSVYTDGCVYLWINEHLAIDGCDAVNKVRTLTSFINISFAPSFGSAPTQTFRLDYIHYMGTSELTLSWKGNYTATEVIPAAAFTSAVSAAEVSRIALKDRLMAPPVQWQTYYNPTMGTHVRMPSALALQATLAVLDGPDAGDVLGDIFVFRQSNPAITYVGPHSYNGSDYTQFTVDAWKGMACTVVFQSTVVNGGADLLFMVTSNGTNCSSQALLIQPTFLWSRAGSFSSPSEGALVGAAPGFPDTLVYAYGAAPAPFPKGGAGSWALPLSSSGGAVGYSTGAQYSLATIQAAIAAAAARQAVSLAKWEGVGLSDVYEPQATIIAWNTMFTPYEGVVTPVSRGWDFGAGYVLFDWDNFFLAKMASLDAESLDICYMNLIQTALMRTELGFVPNFASGTHLSTDRTEPQIGARVALDIYNKWGDAWVIELIFDALLSWNDWVWVYRRGFGSLAGSDGHADLIVLGSNPNDECNFAGGCNTLQDARYESGLDNSPMYDGDDGQGPPGPVTFDPNVTHLMSLYDVGMTGLYLSDTSALIQLATVVNRTDVLPLLQSRFDRISNATLTHLWNEELGIYANVLYNGSFYPRLAPTSFFPFISGTGSAAQAAAAAAVASSPLGFCMNTSYTPAPSAAMLMQWWDGKHDNAACVSLDCMKTVVDVRYSYIRIEAVALSMAAQPTADLIPLALWYSSSRDDYALTNSTSAPPDTVGGYAFIRQEGYAWSSPPTGAYSWPTTQLSLWYSASRKDYQTCGSPDCLYDTKVNGYVFIGDLGYAFNGTGPLNMPCVFSGNSIQRSDPAFFDNNYWRGRIWGPHLQLIYWALKNPAYENNPAVKSARLALVAQSKALLLQEWNLFRQVTENYNGIVGVGEDTGNADPFYHWGSLAGFLSFEEAGLV